jgi:hypothetical protein
VKRIGKVIAFYFMLVGVAVHVLALGPWLGELGLFDPGAHRRDVAAERGFQGTDPAAVAGSEESPQPLAAWQPDLANPLARGEIRVAGGVVESLDQASRRLRDGDTLELGPGVYREGLVLAASGVSLRGRGHVVLDGAAKQGKATLVIQGDDTRVTNIECRNVQVPHRNGACVRLEGRNLTLDGVYFHDSEQGILTWRSPGLVTIRNSRFERLGKNGQAHGIYIGGGRLHILDSLFLSAVSQGHEIKSRAESTLIERSIVASLGGDDSRLLDISNGGELIVRDSVLQEGPATVNNDVIGFALEGARGTSHRMLLTNNIILLDAPRRTRLIHQRQGTPAATMRDNLIIGGPRAEYPATNTVFASREAAGLPPYPALPRAPIATPE